MSLFRFQWLRRFVRRNTYPLQIDKAALWKRRISIAYALIAWNAFGFVLYMMFTGKADWAKYHGIKTENQQPLTPAQQWTQTLGIKDATVYRISGFNVKKYDVHNDFENEKSQTQLDSKETEAA